jgi:16S rRNA (cytosine967-C5)-methyltransferase
LASKVDIAIQDILTQHKSTGEPVDKLVGRLTRARGLGSRDRKLVADAVFEQLRQKPWPAWFAKKISPELEQALRTRAKPVLAVDARFMTALEAQTQLQALGIESRLSNLVNTALILEQDRLNLDTLPKNLQEALWFMDEGSQVVAQQIKAKPGETILDLCAGGGGKTRMMLATGAKITAVDQSDKRLAKILSVKRIVADGRTISLPPFDWILIDAPCSGTGTLRRSPDIFGRLKETDIANYATLQRELVANAVKLLKPTGKLVYATCSVLNEENHAKFDSLELIESKQLLPSKEGCDGFYWACFQLG